MTTSRKIALKGIGSDSRSVALNGLFGVITIIRIGRRIGARLPNRYIMPGGGMFTRNRR